MTKLDIIKLEEGEVIFREGEVSTQMYFVKSGKLKVTKVFDGEDVVLGYVTPGEIVGEISYFDKKPRSASVCTVEETELAVIPSEKFQKLFKELPAWSQALTKSLVKRVRSRNDEVSL
tara:strand:+ start:316 stop:669 length:354 start_codon:yes stop_codon:yes gene_type:complete